MRTTCPAHFTFDFITRTILGEEYKLWSFSLCNFLRSPVNFISVSFYYSF